MKRKFLITFALICLMVALLTACNNSTPDFTEYGYSVGGKITLHNLPDGTKAEVTILVNTKEVATADDNGVFYVKNLEKGDIVSFAMNNVTFYPNEQIVREDIHDLRIDGYYEEQ